MGKRYEAEREYVAAYVATFYPDCRAMFDFRLGAIETELPADGLTQEELNIIGATRRFADAVVCRPTELIIIEGAIRPDLGKVSILHGYSRLVRVTPELAQWRDLPLKMELVGCIYDPVIDQVAREWGIRLVTWTTPEALGYIKTLAARMSRPPRPAGFA